MISTSAKLDRATSQSLSQGSREKVSTYFYPTRIDFPLNLREQIVALLNQSLATNADRYYSGLIFPVVMLIVSQATVVFEKS